MHNYGPDVKQSEKENIAPAILFDMIYLLEVLIAAVYFFAFLFLDALNFSLRALACGLSLRFNMACDGHDKPFCTKAITIIDNFKKAQGDTDNR